MIAADTLRRVAEVLDGLPGIPPPNVTVASEGNVSISIPETSADVATRTAAIDMLAATMGLTAGEIGTTDGAESFHIATGEYRGDSYWLQTPTTLAAVWK